MHPTNTQTPPDPIFQICFWLFFWLCLTVYPLHRVSRFLLLSSKVICQTKTKKPYKNKQKTNKCNKQSCLMVILWWLMSSTAKISVHSLFVSLWLLQHQALSSTCQSFSLYSQENCKTWQLHPPIVQSCFDHPPKLIFVTIATSSSGVKFLRLV